MSEDSMSKLRFLCVNEGAPLLGDFLKFPASVKRVKVDVGLSHDAPQSFRWLQDDPNVGVVGIEPLSQNVSGVKRLIEARNLQQSVRERFIILPIALGDEVGTRVVFVTDGDAGSSSFFQPKLYAVSHNELVPVFRLDDVLELISPFDFPRIDYLKTDCQGADLEILMSGSNGLARVAVVTAEAENQAYIGTSNSEKSLDAYLNSLGFVRYNPRSAVRRLIGNAFSRFNWVQVAYSSIKKNSKLRTLSKSGQRRIQVEDPTYFNSRHLEIVESGEVTAFQEG